MMKRKPTYKKLEETDRTILHDGHFYESIIDCLPGAFYFFDKKGRFLRWNRTFEDITGYSAEEISRMNPLDFFVEEDRKKVGEKIQEVFTKGKSSVKASIASRSGNIIPFYFTGVRLMIDNRSCLVGMGTDISELKQAEDALRESEERYRSLVESTEDPVFLVDRNFRFLYMNKEYFSRRGQGTKVQIIGRTYSEFHSKDETKEFEEKIEEVFKSGRSIQHEYMRKFDGRYFLRTLSPMRKANGRISSVTVVSKDITERKQAEEMLQKAHKNLEQKVDERTAELLRTNVELKNEIEEHRKAVSAMIESEERYRLLFNSVYDAVFVHELTEEGMSGPFIEVNDIACQKYGYTREELLSMNPRDLRAPEATVNVQDRTRDLFTNKHVLFEAVQVTKDGKRIQVEINSHLFELKGRHTVIAIARDITERKRVEKALKESEERLELKNIRLEEANTALKVLLNKRDEDKTELEKSVLLNMKELILPYLEKIRESGLNKTQNIYADVLESNLNEVILPFTHRLSSEFTNLTPAEIKVANLVRQGQTTKDIAELMHLSHRTIESHRNNLRRKLGLKTKQENLRSRLLSIQ